MSPKPDFLALVSAKAEVDLRLSDFAPRSMLVTLQHLPERPKFPAIDYHNHLDSQDPTAVLHIMDECGIERIVSITMRVGEDALATMKRFQSAAQNRFSTIAWMDWSDLHTSDFYQRSVERLEQFTAAGGRGIKLWKDLGLTLRNQNGDLLRVDDERQPYWRRVAPHVETSRRRKRSAPVRPRHTQSVKGHMEGLQSHCISASC